MDIKEFAKSISGKEYGYPQFTREEIEIAKENGFVIVYGCSDDLMEFDGAIREEIGCYNGGTAWVKGDRITDAPIVIGQKSVRAIWCGGEKNTGGHEITWTYETELPHETFMIYEGSEPYCRGIVFNINDVKADATALFEKLWKWPGEQQNGGRFRADGAVLTNADWIRGMNNAQLAEFLCRVKADYQWAGHEFPSEDACGDWEKWLESEVSE